MSKRTKEMAKNAEQTREHLTTFYPLDESDVEEILKEKRDKKKKKKKALIKRVEKLEKKIKKLEKRLKK